MLVDSYYKENLHVRKRHGRNEKVKTRQKQYILECDGCGARYEKTSKHFKNTSVHACSNCNSYKIAQQASVKQRRINQYVDQFDASSSRAIGSFRINISSGS